MFLLSEIQKPDAILHSLYNPQTNVLTLARIHSIDYYKVDPQTGSKKRIVSIAMEHAIFAIAQYKLNSVGPATVVFCDNYGLYLVYKNQNLAYVVKELTRLSPLGQQFSVDSSPVIVVDPAEVPRYILLHCFQGLVHKIDIDPFVATEEVPKATKKPRLKSKVNTLAMAHVESVSIGSVVVLKMTMLKNTSVDIVAILYRDFNFNYSLRYWSVNSETHFLKLALQLGEFEEPPTGMLSPEQGGLFVVSSTKIFYFPGPKNTVYLSNEDIDYSVVVRNNVVTKDLTQTMPKDIVKESFVSLEAVDNSRIMVTSSSGSTYMLFYVMTLLSASITVKQLNYIELGKSTIPIANGLFHINKNVFFQASRTSRSVFFEVLPNKPHILVKSHIDSSPPLLDIVVDSEAIETFYSSHGGENGGELRKYSKPKREVNIIDSQRISSLPRRILYASESEIVTMNVDGLKDTFEWDGEELSKSTSSDIQIDKLLQYKSLSGYKICITEEAVLVNNRTKLRDEIVYGVVSDKGSYLVRNSKNELYLARQHSKPVKVAELESTVADLLDLSNSLVSVVADWKGKCYLIVSGNNLLVHDISSSFLGVNNEPQVIHSTILVKSGKENIVEMLVHLQSGITLAYEFNYKSGKIILGKEITSSKIPQQFVKSGDGSILLFSEQGAIGLRKDTRSQSWMAFEYSSKLTNLHDMLFLSSNTFAVLKGVNLEVYSVQSGFEGTDYAISSIFTTDACTRVLHFPEYNWIVSIYSGLRYYDYEGVKRYTYLKLIDSSKMRTLHKFHFKDNVNLEFVDLCRLPSDGEEDEEELVISFLALVNNNNDKPILEFHISSNKIRLVHGYSISGLKGSSELTLLSISILDEEESTFLISGNFVFVCQRTNDLGEVSWDYVRETLKMVPVHAVAQAIISNDEAVIGDAVNGLLNYNRTMADLKLKNIPLQYEHYLMSSVSAFLSYVITGDCIGNVSLLEGTNQVAAFNVGEQVNVVKSCARELSNNSKHFQQKFGGLRQLAYIGTVNGGIYKLSEVFENPEEPVLDQVATAEWAKTDWKMLVKNRDGTFLRKPAIDTVTVGQIQHFLELSIGLGTLRKSKKKADNGSKTKSKLSSIIYEAS